MLAFFLPLCVPAAAQLKAPAERRPDYLNPQLPIERRVADLVGRMTLEEKVAQTMNKAPAIERLGVPAYDWWNEALHGVAYAGNGFRGGDRTELGLPKVQEDLLKAVHATGKPVVLLLFSGEGLAVNWADANVPAILQAWYPGEEGGSGIADVLFGDYNPAGRLPVTFYKSASQLPPFEDYGMQGKTYRYFKGDPLYPFGHGLSYTRFEYRGLKLKKSVTAGENLQVSAEVRNTGQLAGDEVVQLYLSDVEASAPVPIRALRGVERIHLRPGETRRVAFTLKPVDMAFVDAGGKHVLEPGEFRVAIGGKQPGFSGHADAATTGTLSGSFIVKGKKIVIP